ncbi:MAG: hypothetical protein OES47_09155 [Acidobacteriota bacterium]|nr:hypothetical protein [Acidobacteriota bacterium]
MDARRIRVRVRAADRELWRSILRGVSSTQLGLDFAFDIFVSMGTVLLGLQMLRHPRFASWFFGVWMSLTVLPVWRFRRWTAREGGS